MTTNDRTDLGLNASTTGCSCCSTPKSTTAQNPASAGSTERHVLVTGMTCSHCVASVTEELTAIDGVEGVSVDLHAGGTSRVTIHSAAPIDGASVKAAVEEAGYALAADPS